MKEPDPFLDGRCRQVCDVVVLFSDLCNYYEKTRTLSPTASLHVVEPVLARMIECVKLRQGRIIRLMGDAILAVFGLQVPLRVAGMSAIDAALDINRRISGLGFEARTGINCGSATVGWIGSDLYREFTVVGEPADLAAKLRSEAKNGEILIGGGLYHQIATQVHCAPRSIRIKGNPKAIVVYSVQRRLEVIS